MTKARDRAILADLPNISAQQVDPLLEVIDNLDDRVMTDEQKQTREDIKIAIKKRNNLL